jgi:hypothetical protein
MSDYFDRVEQALRHATAEGRHIPWYRRVNLDPPVGVRLRPFGVAGGCLRGWGVEGGVAGAFRGA